MEIKPIKRPWEKKTNYGHRLKKDPFYQSSTWKRTKKSFKQGKTKANNGFMLPNTMCIDCYNESGLLNDKNIEIDHDDPIEEGGSRTEHNNLRARCKHHHSKKSAREGNQRRKNK